MGWCAFLDAALLMVRSILLLLWLLCSSSFAHEADPTGEMAKYVIYGQDSLSILNQSGFSADGLIGSNGKMELGSWYAYKFYDYVNVGGALTTNASATFDSLVQADSESGGATYSAGVVTGTSVSYTVPLFPTPVPTISSGSTNCTYTGTGWGSCPTETDPVSGDVCLKAGTGYGTIDIQGTGACFVKGAYHIENLIVKTHLKIRKTSSEVTRILVKTAFTMPWGGYDAVDPTDIDLYQNTIKTTEADDYGTVLIYVNGSATFNSGSVLHATIVAPNAVLTLNSQMAVFGQVLAKAVKINDGFNGALGKFVSFNPAKIYLVGAGTNNIKEDSNSVVGNTDSRFTKVSVELEKGIDSVGMSVDYLIRTISTGTATDTALLSGSDADIRLDTNHAGNANISTGTLHWNRNETAPYDSILVYVNDDAAFEGLEYFELVLYNPQVSALANDANAEKVWDTDIDGVVDSLVYHVAVESDDLPYVAPSISVATNNATQNEGSSGGTTTFTFDVSLSSVVSEDVSVTLKTQDGTATLADSDYLALDTTILFSAGESSKTLSVTVNHDTKYEGNDAFTVVLSSPTNSATLATASATGTITNDDISPTVTLTTSTDTIVENNASGNFIATLSNLAHENITVTLAYSGTASASDYNAASTTIVVPAGSLSATVAITSVQDAIYEGNESVIGTVVGVTNKTAGSFGTTLIDTMIIKDDETLPSLSIADVTVAEDVASGKVTLTVTSTEFAQSDITINYATSNGTATAASDYTSKASTVTILAGQKTASFDISILDDSNYEGSETFTVTLSSPTLGSFSDSLAQVTITDSETAPSITIADVTVAEDVASGKVTLTVTSTEASQSGITINYATSNGTATAASDYTSKASTVTIPAGQKTATFDISILDDSNYEGSETFTITLSSPSVGTLADAFSQVTITDSESVPTISIADATVAEDVASGKVTLTITATEASQSAITIDYATSNGTAISPSDYIAKTATATIPAGQKTITFDISIVDDSNYEGSETFTVALTNPSVGSFTDASAQVTITDSESAPTLSIADAIVAEDVASGKVTLTVTSSEATQSGITINYATSNGTATASSDYTAKTSTVTIPAGQKTATFDIAILDDSNYEGSETFTVTLSSPSVGSFSDASSQVTITDSESAPTISIADATVAEDVASGKVTLTVTSTEFAQSDITINYATSNGTATSGADYTAKTSTVTIPAGQKTATFDINILDDSNYEGSETFTVTLSSPSVGSFSDASSQVTITDSESAPTISIADATVAEDVASGKVTLTVTSSEATQSGITITYATSNGTATAGSDYTAKTSTVTIPAGQKTATFDISILDDSNYEGSETFTVTLSSPSVGSFSDASSQIAITDSESAPTLSIADATVAEDVASGKVTLTVTSSEATQSGITITYATSNGTATAGSDYTAKTSTVTIPAGQKTATFDVSILDDSNYEGSETFTVTLSSPSVGSFSDASSQVTITDSESAPSFSIGDATVAEEVVSGKVTLTVIATESSQSAVTINYATSNGTASAGSDYTAKTGTITIPAGLKSKAFDISILDDSNYEGSETFTVTLSSPSVGSFSDASSQVTITEAELAPGVSIADVSVAEEVVAGKVLVTISSSVTSQNIITVDYTTVDSTAKSGSDYTAKTGTASILVGQTSVTIEVPILDDSNYEGTEYFKIVLSNVSEGAIGDGTGVITITESESVPSLSIADVTVAEEVVSGKVTLTVTSTESFQNAITLDYATSNGTASAGTDYTAKTGTVTIPAGQKTITFDVAILDDAHYEGSETFTVTLSNASIGSFTDASAQVTITESESVPSFSLADETVAEEVASGKVTLTVTSTESSQNAITIDYATSNGTATAGSDYTAKTGTVTIPAGQKTITFDIAILDDAHYEGSETFAVTLSNASIGSFTDASSQVTITESESVPSLSIADATVAEEVANGKVTLTVTSTESSQNAITIDYATSNGTATASSDYTAKTGTVTIPAGQKTITFDIAILDDSNYEGSETFAVTLSNASVGTFSDASSQVTITEAESLPGISIADVTVAEEVVGGKVTLTISSTESSANIRTIDYATTNGTAKSPSDYTAKTSTATIPVGQKTVTIEIDINDDSHFEGTENFTVTLSNLSEGVIADSTSTVTITEAESMPEVSVANESVAEEVVSGKVTMTVSINQTSEDDITFDYTTNNGTATAGADYTAKTGNLTILAGQTSVTLDIAILDDSRYEGIENFDFNLSNVSNATFSDSSATVTITEAENIPQISVADVSVAEEVASQKVSVVITTSQSAQSAISINYKMLDASATSPSDYIAQTGTAIIPIGQTSVSIDVTIKDDVKYEGTEEFIFVLNSTTIGTISDDSATVTITEAEVAPVISIANKIVSESAGTVTLKVVSTVQSQGSITVQYATADVSAKSISDYVAKNGTISIPTGDTEASIVIAITDDALVENDETFTVTLANPNVGSLAAPGIATVQITDDDTAPTIAKAITDTTLLEDFAPKVVYDLTKIFSDTDGSALVYSVSTPANLKANIVADSLILTAIANDNGVDQIIVTATDGVNPAAIDTFAVAVTAVNDTVILTAMPNATTPEETPITFAISFDDVDLNFEGDVHTLNVSSSNASVSVTAPSSNTSGATFTATPAKDSIGTSIITIIAQDSSGLADTISFVLTITDVNDKPVRVAQIADFVLQEDFADTTVVKDLKDYFKDVESTLTYSLQLNNAKVLASVVNDAIVLKSVQDENGTVTIVATASDGTASIADTFTVAIQPVNDDPVIVANDISVFEDAIVNTVLQTIQVTDVDLDAISFSLDSVTSSNKLVADQLTLGQDGKLTLKKALDYEAHKDFSVYVTITSGTQDSLIVLKLTVQNKVEETHVAIIKAVNLDSTYLKPDTLWVSDATVDFTYEIESKTLDSTYIAKDGKQIFSVEYKAEDKDVQGRDVVVLYRNTIAPVITIDTVGQPKDSLGVLQTNKDVTDLVATVVVVSSDLSLDTLQIPVKDSLVDGLNTVSVSHTDKFGNTSTTTIWVNLDRVAPDVKIVSPIRNQVIPTGFTKVHWTVDGVDMLVDTLETFTEEGRNTIIRSFTDLAGNTGSDTVIVVMQFGNNQIEIEVVDKLVKPKDKDATTYYEDKHRSEIPEKEVYSVFIVVKKNPDGTDISDKPWNELTPEEKKQALVLHEVAWETEDGKKTVEEDAESRADIVGLEHLGITMEMNLQFPDNTVPEGKSIGNCFEGDLLWDMTVAPIRVDVFDNIGQFVTGFEVPTVSIDDPRYLDANGNVTLRVELPLPQGAMQSSSGSIAATGIYYLSTALSTQAVPRECNTFGRTRHTSRSILKPVGYYRN